MERIDTTEGSQGGGGGVGRGLLSNCLERQGCRVYTAGSPWERWSAALDLGPLSLPNGVTDAS